MNKLLTLGLAMCTVVAASAQVVRIDVDYIDNMGKVPGDTYVYAVMQNEGDILDAVYGEASAPLKVTSTAPFIATRRYPLSASIRATTPCKTKPCWILG